MVVVERFCVFFKKTRKFISFDDVLPSKVSSNGLQSIIERTSIYHRTDFKTSSIEDQNIIGRNTFQFSK